MILDLKMASLFTHISICQTGGNITYLLTSYLPVNQTLAIMHLANEIKLCNSRSDETLDNLLLDYPFLPILFIFYSYMLTFITLFLLIVMYFR